MKINFTRGGKIEERYIPVCEYGDTRGNYPESADLRGVGEIPEGYELLTSYEGWEEGEKIFLAPLGAEFVQIKKGSAHYCGTWECRRGRFCHG